MCRKGKDYRCTIERIRVESFRDDRNYYEIKILYLLLRELALNDRDLRNNGRKTNVPSK